VRRFAWPAIFVLGGLLPLLLLPLLALGLPESITPRTTSSQPRLLGVLFRDGLRSRTLLLWAINILSFLSVYFILLWVPALLHSQGVSSSRAILGTTIYGLGVAASPVLTAFVADLGLIIGTVCLLLTGLLEPQFSLLLLLLCGAGIGGGCQGGINSLSALTYPHPVRSTGAGWALGVGRIGTMAGPLLGGLLLGFGVRTQSIFIAASTTVFGAAALMAILGSLRRVSPRRDQSSA